MKKILFLIIIIFSIFSCKQENIEKRVNITTVKEKERGITKYNFYKKNGALEKTLEYVNLCDKKYLNQGWYFMNDKDTLFEKSNFYKIDVQKSILHPMETSEIRIFYKPLLKNSISRLLISNKNIDLNYCNINDVKLDTIYFVDNNLVFLQSFKNKGHVNLGGYIVEMSNDLIKVGNHNEYYERKTYLSISFEVR